MIAHAGLRWIFNKTKIKNVLPRVVSCEIDLSSVLTVLRVAIEYFLQEYTFASRQKYKRGKNDFRSIYV